MNGRDVVVVLLGGGLLLVTLPLAAALFFWPVQGAAAEPGIVVGAQTRLDGTVRLEVEVDGLRPGDEYVAEIAVPVEDGSITSVGVLGRLVADADGVGSIEADAAAVAGGEVVLTAALFAPPGREIAILAEGGDTVARITVVLPARSSD